ncbi:hypothetical protein EVJ58_g7597 [Rhodofomes roseus]|uniref:Uncharacterized protein n=1 Tax=Rhodofomes roseus TaxID=34475 RepID=A0A4Y9Y341_9APHY|nr:hypothetical protein EVJ58_g7597 [Rhodofomes roseus]
MRAFYLSFLAYAFIAFAAPISLTGTSVAAATDSVVPSVTSVVIPTASLTAIAPAPSSSPVPSSTESSGDENEDENEDDEPDENEDEPDENEPDEDEPDEEEDDGEHEAGSGGGDDDSHSSDDHQKFTVEIEIEVKHSDLDLSSFLPPADGDLDIEVKLDPAKAESLLMIFFGDLDRVLEDTAYIVEAGGSGAGNDSVNRSPQNGTLTTQVSRTSAPSVGLASRSDEEITLRAKAHLHEDN